MDKKKAFKERKKHSMRKQTIAKTRKERESLNFLRDMQKQGLEKIYLTPLTQKVLDCRIGENINPETRWVFIKKEKIEDNMFLHDTSSEFLPIRAKIEKYPEQEMLIGSYSHIQDKETDFFLCTTLKVKENILQMIESERICIYERMWNILHPIPRPWKNLGSQVDVDDSLIKKNRSLFEIILTTEYPIPYHYTTFKMCLAQDMPNSYIATGPGRFSHNLILRKRVDKSTQSTLPTEDKSFQSILSVSRNKHVQYSYHCDFIQLTEESLEVIKTFFENKCAILYETLLVNFNINLFCDDYKELAINDRGIAFKDPTELRSYQEVINCKHKKVSCISWNALISGMVAVAYTITPIYYIGKHSPIHNDADDTVYEKHLILLWTYKDNVRPKLYIHAYREVTALSFCPYDANILVGGYSNGQIAVWDITNRISAIETREVLTHLQQHHRDIMNAQTSWIKPAFGIQHVFPTITSLFGSSHLSAVTSISWIPPSHYISRNGRYETSKEDQEHMQFLSVGLNGSTIQVWDLKIQKQQSEKKSWKKRTNRLSKLPDALTQTESPLKRLQKFFVPYYRLCIKDPSSGIKNPVTNIIAKNQLYVYDPINPKTLGNIEERSYFRMRSLLHPFNEEKELILCSALGSMFIVKWEGSAYNQGLSINSEPCTLSYFADVHDGPITSCEMNPFLPEVMLTTGGSIFAIWDYRSLNVPLVWRKANSRYISGMWSFRHPLAIIMTRSDSHFEIWNLVESSDNPVRCFKYKGNQMVSLFNDQTRLHVRKETFITSDIGGAFKIFNLPSGMISLRDSNMDESIAFLENIIQIKKITEQLKIKYKKLLENAALTKQQQEEEMEETTVPVLEPTEPQSSSKMVSHVRLETVVQTAVNKWQKRLEKHMYNILLEKKRLNVDEIESNRKPMQILMDQEARKEAKINNKIMTREEDFKKVKDTLLVPIESLKIRRKITVTLSKEKTKILKQRYYENFKKIEAETIQQINASRFKFNLNWNQMLEFGIAANK